MRGLRPPAPRQRLAAWWVPVAIASLVVLSRDAAPLDIPGFTAAVNDRFVSGFPANPVPNTDPSFIGTGYDWSGVAWSTYPDVPSPGYYKGFAMLSPRHTLVAQHFYNGNDDPRIRGRDGVVSTQPDTSVTNLGYGLQIDGQYDLAVATLAAPITAPANMARYAVLDLYSTSSSTTYSVYNNLSLLAYGRGADTTSSPRVGAATVLSAQLATSTNAFTPVILTARSGTTPSVQLVVGDSGSPLMHGWTNPDGQAELTLLGLNSSYTIDNLYNVMSMLAAAGPMANATDLMADTGYALRVAGPTTATWVGNTSTNISNRLAWGISAPFSAPSDAYVLFNGTTASSRSVTVDTNRNLRGLYFKTTETGSLGFTFSGASTLTLGRGGLTNYDASRQTFSANLSLGDAQYWDVGAGGVTAANVNTAGWLLEIAGSGTARITGAVSGTGGLALSGHRLELSGSSSYTGGTWVHAGTLVVDGTIATSSAVILDAGATLAGSGRVAALSGAGMIGPGNSPGILTAPSVSGSGGLDFSFEFTGTGSPVWSNATASGNDVLRLTDPTTPFPTNLSATNLIDVYFDVPTIGMGESFLGGFFTDKSGDFLASIDDATFTFYVRGDGLGTAKIYNGQGYYLLDTSLFPWFTGVDISTTAVASANFSGGTVTNGQVTQFVVVPEPHALLLAAVGAASAWRLRRRALR